MIHFAVLLTEADEPVLKITQAVDMLNNRYLSVTIDDLLNQPEVVDKLDSDMEKVLKGLSQLEDKYIDSDEATADKLSELYNELLKKQNQLSDFKDAIKKA